ncbi:ataxin-10 [Onthophagus taurus]|uniref:ataxin-10 n=1 Tax=Onthophagus taurus TaxID=166361 RepID=UPI000C1FFF41|nr:ataxin-10 [Onthophagus taurus]
MKDEEFKKIATEYLERNEYSFLIELVRETFKLTVINSKLTVISEEMITCLGELLNKSIGLISETLDENVILLIEHIFKALRNATVGNQSSQNWITSNESILNDTHTFCELYRAINEPYIISCISVLLQFLNNLVVKNQESSRLVWNKFKEFIGDFISDKNYSYFSSALAYNMLYTAVTMLKDNELILRSIFDVYKDYESNEYLHFLLELFVKNKDLNISYVSYDTEHRILFLTMLKDLLQESRVDVNINLIQTLSNEFKVKSDCILKTIADYVDKIEPIEVTLLLDDLAIISSNDTYLPLIQSDKSLLITCIFLLKSIHEVSKQPDNNFTMMSKLSDLTISGNKADITLHPAFGFKASLIRLIGNMCWKHIGNQHEVRELEGIPLLLDCCNMDARNPLIIQWIVYALRNLCENNLENQKAISSITKLGVVDSETLNEIGITLSDDGSNCIKIAPYPNV